MCFPEWEANGFTREAGHFPFPSISSATLLTQERGVDPASSARGKAESIHSYSSSLSAGSSACAGGMSAANPAETPVNKPQL